MQLISVDKKTIITMEEVDPRDPAGRYSMRVEIQPAAGRFSGENDAVYFLNLAEFKLAFDKFLRTHESSAALESAEGCRLEFFRWNPIGDVGVRYAVSRGIFEGDPPQVNAVALSGKFMLDAEFVNQAADELLQLLKA